MTRIFKVFHAIPRFKTVLNTLVDILPSLLTYGSILFVIFYFFAIIGMELFQVPSLYLNRAPIQSIMQSLQICNQQTHHPIIDRI